MAAEPKGNLSADSLCGLAALNRCRNPRLWKGSAEPWPHGCRSPALARDYDVSAAGFLQGQCRWWRWQDITTPLRMLAGFTEMLRNGDYLCSFNELSRWGPWQKPTRGACPALRTSEARHVTKAHVCGPKEALPSSPSLGLV